MFVFLRKKENIFRVLLCLYFAYFFWSRVVYLSSDSPAYMLDVEEKATAYNARNKVLFENPASGGNHYEPMISSPLPAVVSYLYFLFFGVSLFSLRLPYALLSVLAIFVFYKVLKKETNSWMAFLGIVLLGSAHFILLLNRSALVENFFILLPAVALYFYQDYAENKKDASLLLFGLFAALNVAVKYSGAYFLLISAIGVLMIFFRRDRGFSSGEIRACLFFAGGVLLGLIPTVIALILGKETGALETLKLQCSIHLDAGAYLYRNIRYEYPLFFIKNFPLLSLAAMTGLFSMLFLRPRKWSRTDRFVLLWSVLGSATAFFCIITCKRLIFLIWPLIYLAVKGGYGLWLALRRSNMPDGCEGNSFSFWWQSRRGAFIWKILSVCGFVVLLSWVGQYALCQHPIPNYGLITYAFLLTFSTFMSLPGACAGLIQAGIFLGLMIAPIAGGVSGFIITRDRDKAFEVLKRWFVAALFIFLIAASGLSIASNEVCNSDFLFHPENIRYKSYNNSRDVGRKLKDATVIGSEYAFRMLGFENRCKFIFNHDGIKSAGRNPYDADIDDIILRKDVRYFCLYVSDSGLYLQHTEPGINKIRAAYPGLKHIQSYSFETTFFLLFDKYPYLGSES